MVGTCISAGISARSALPSGTAWTKGIATAGRFSPLPVTSRGYSHAPQHLGCCLDRPVDVVLAVRGRHHPRLVLGGRQIDPPMEHGVEKASEGRRIRCLRAA